MSKDFPLYPELTQEGKDEAQRIMDSFKPKILALVEEVMQNLYCDVSMHVESDHWINYRTQILQGLSSYKENNKKHGIAFDELRKYIYESNKEQIIKDLNQDLVEENLKLKSENESLFEKLYRN